MKKKILLPLLLLCVGSCAVATVTGCNNNSGSNEPTTMETLISKDSIALTVYEEYALNLDYDGAEKPLWSVADPTVVKVENGKLIALKEYNGETLSTRQIPVKVEKPHLKTKVDVPVKIGNANATFDAKASLGEGYSIGKVVEVATGVDYDYANGADLSRLDVGEYTFAVYEANEEFSTEVNVVVADYLVSTAAELKEATAALNAYVVLVNDLDAGTFANSAASVTVGIGADGTFNGLGHTLTVTYNTNGCSLYSYVNDFTFKNLAVKCTITATSQNGALFRQVIASGTVNIENCYLESTIAKDNAKRIGGIADYFWGSCGVNISNTIVKVNGLDRSDTVQKNCGALFSTWISGRYNFENLYVIASGTLAAIEEVAANNSEKANKITGVLYQNENTFAAAKAGGDIVLDNFNHYWDLTGTVPQFKQ